MKRRRAWKWVLGSSGALCLLIAVFFTWVQAVASRRWAEIGARVPALIAEARARDPRRPPVRGEPVPGNAWQDYDQALTAIQPRLASDLERFVERFPKADRAKAMAAVVAQESCLAFLSAGARKSEATLPYEYEKGYAAKVAHIAASQHLTFLAVSKARLLAEAGKGTEAADLLVDVLWFATDMGRNSVLIAEILAMGCLKHGLNELRELVVDEALKEVDWTEIGRALAVLDEAWPDHGEALLNEGASWAVCLASQDSLGTGLVGEIGAGVLFGWRYGFSMRLMVADAADTCLDFMRRSAAASGSWTDLWRVDQEIEAEIQASPNTVTKIIGPGLIASHRVAFERRAQLRLLRMAVAIRAGAPAPDLDDPVGGKLKSDGTKVWSLGQDGVDGGGVGEWRPPRAGDIVLQFKKDELDLKKK